MRRDLRLAPMLTAAAVGIGGCGSTAARPLSGAEVFASHCTACHSLDGRDHPALMGGDLLHFRAPRNELRQLVGEMPVRRPLRRAELAAVVSYVERVTRGA